MLKHPNAFKTLLLAPSHTPQVPSPYPQVLFALGYYRYIKNANFASLYIGTHEMKVSPILSQTIIAATKIQYWHQNEVAQSLDYSFPWF